jgi:hypothetical protein
VKTASKIKFQKFAFLSKQYICYYAAMSRFEGTLTKGKGSTVDLRVKVACFVKKEKK